MDLLGLKLDHADFLLTLGDGGKNDIAKFPEKQLAIIRYACCTNLRFLANCVLRSKGGKMISLSESVQGKIIDALLKPDPLKDFNEWDSMKQFVVLASRGMLKSTIGAAFLTQVILCCPDIRILVISGALGKSKTILETARNPFLNNDVLRFLFPSWLLEEKDIKADSFVCPKRDKGLNYRDPTIAISSFESVKAGGHYEIVLFDDATNEINSKTIDNCQKTIDQYDDTYPLVEPGGYRVFLGTKWNDNDLPANIKNESDESERLRGKPTAKYFSLPVWTVKKDGTAAEVTARTSREKVGGLTSDDVILTWPEKLDNSYCFGLYHKRKDFFYSQYLLDTTAEQQRSFLPATLDKQMIPSSEIRKMVPNHDAAFFIHWDMAGVITKGKPKSETDYSCGIAGMFKKSTAELFIIKCVLAHFTGTDDASAAIVNFFKETSQLGPVSGHSIEDTGGSRLFADSIERATQTLKPNKWVPINYIIPESIHGAKNIRIAGLASAMKAGFVYIANDMNYVSEVRAQLSNWDITATRRKDDAPDCIASIWKHYRNLIQPNSVNIMETDGPVLSWEPETLTEAPDPHADEKANADIEWLSKDTVLFN